MKRSRCLFAALLLVPFVGTVAQGSPAVESVLKQMPADYPLGAIVVDFEKFDKSLIAYARNIDPKSEFQGMLADMKRNLGVAPWIDFTRPVGLVQPTFQGGEPVIYATIPNFLEKAKGLADAKEEEGGIWFLPFEAMDDLYAAVKGDLVIAASDKTQLESVLKKEGRTLADGLRPRLDLLTGRDVYVHLNFEAVRPMAQMSIMQATQMAPMMAMMAAQQGGGDPASMTAVFSSIVDAAKNFVDQADFVDIVLGVSADTARTTIATGFKEGDIKTYLSKTKPAAALPLATLEDQKFTLAMAWHIPGDESPFINYLFGKMMAPQGTENSAAAEGSQIARDLFSKVEGMNLVMNMDKSGMTSAGDYLGKDVAGILNLASKSIVKESPMTEMLSSGISYEAAGEKTFGGNKVQAFTMKIDPASPSAEEAGKMMGSNTTLFMGSMDGRVGYFMGPEADAEKYFSGKVSKPLSTNSFVAEALKALPANRNLVILLDPAGVIPAFGSLLGLETPENVSPGPPVAISASFSGEYARTDVIVPAKTIGRVLEAVSPQPPT
jgi:hypothetical protein